MRLIVLSDSHGMKSYLFDIVEKHIGEAESFLCLGDCNSGRDFDDIYAIYGNKFKCEFVRGNCDFGSDAPLVKTLTFGGKKIFMCHGHTFNVKMSTYDLENAAEREKSDIALFGHTHEPYNEYISYVHFFNPGAVMRYGQYGIIDITPQGIVCINAKL